MLNFIKLMFWWKFGKEEKKDLKETFSIHDNLQNIKIRRTSLKKNYEISNRQTIQNASNGLFLD